MVCARRGGNLLRRAPRADRGKAEGGNLLCGASRADGGQVEGGASNTGRLWGKWHINS